MVQDKCSEGFVWLQQAQVHCSAIPSFAHRPAPAWQDTPCQLTSPQLGPREVGLSILDEQAGPHVLCCGHMLHLTCLTRHRQVFFASELAARASSMSVIKPAHLICDTPLYHVCGWANCTCGLPPWES